MTSAPTHARLRKVPGIDGLRGFAVVAVVLYHFFTPAFPGGFLGVDVFFVLSGFLITSLLVRERATTGRISLKVFWTRRVRRILPAAFTVMFAVAAITLAIAGNSQVGMGWQMLAILTFSNNWMQIAQSHSYFGNTIPQVFSHYWSLAVEEQFYVVWPLLFTALASRGWSRRRWMVLTAGLATASALLMAFLFQPGTDPTRVYYGTDTHAFGLLVGAFLAVWLSSRSGSALADSWPRYGRGRFTDGVLSVAAMAALVGLIALCVFLPAQGEITYRGGIVIASLCTALILYTIIHKIHPLDQIFEWHPLRWLGERSFSLYLWHWPLIVIISEPFTAHGEKNSVIAAALALAFTIPLAHLWYQWIEQPFRRQGIGATIAGFFQPLVRFWKQPRRALRTVLVTVVSLTTIGAAIASAITAPTTSQLEQDLQNLRHRGTSTRPGLARLWEPQQEERTFPEGTDISALGDSVMLASLPAIEAAFPGIYINADISRHWSWLPDQITQMKAAGTLDPFVILGFGTNGSAAVGEIDKILSLIGPDHVVVLITPYGDRPWMALSRQQILQAARTHPNVYIARWYSAVEANPTVVREDGIHPGEAGGRLYAYLIRDALQRWVNYGPQI